MARPGTAFFLLLFSLSRYLFFVGKRIVPAGKIVSHKSFIDRKSVLVPGNGAFAPLEAHPYPLNFRTFNLDSFSDLISND